MKILFIEADAHLDHDQEKFAQRLVEDGNEVTISTDCYSEQGFDLLRICLKMNIYDAIFVQTTFTYTDKFKQFLPLYGLISHPVELWYAGHSSAAAFTHYIPEQYLDKFKLYDIWMLAYGEDKLKDQWKREVKL